MHHEKLPTFKEFVATNDLWSFGDDIFDGVRRGDWLLQREYLSQRNAYNTLHAQLAAYYRSRVVSAGSLCAVYLSVLAGILCAVSQFPWLAAGSILGAAVAWGIHTNYAPEYFERERLFFECTALSVRSDSIRRKLNTEPGTEAEHGSS